MRKIAIIYYFKDSLDYVARYDRVSSEFPEIIPPQGLPREDFKGLKQDSVFLVSIDEVGTPKFLARMDPNESESNIRQALIYAIAGKFDDLDEKKAKTVWKGGDPSSSNGIFEGPGLDVPWPQIGIGDIWNKIKDLFKFNWVPWWAWAAVSTISTVKATRSKTVVGQSLYGVISAFSAFKAIKKYNN